MIIDTTSERFSKALRLVVEADRWTPLRAAEGPFAFAVPSQDPKKTGTAYVANAYDCTCEDHYFRRHPCKHMMAVELRDLLTRGF